MYTMQVIGAGDLSGSDVFDGGVEEEEEDTVGVAWKGVKCTVYPSISRMSR